MTPDELLSLAGNPQFISGIYNYCDRWCERCHATDRCLLFATEPKEAADPNATEEEKNEAFLKQLHDSFQLTIDLIKKVAAEEGIDLTDKSKLDAAYYERESARENLKETPLSQLSHDYLMKAHDWFKGLEVIARQKDNELQQALMLGLPGRNPQQESLEIKHTLETLQWYHTQIHVKLMRAQSSRLDEADEPVFDDDDDTVYPKDSEGSAKVALIGIERSIGAWGLLLRHFPEQEEDILGFLSQLQRLLQMAEGEFPGARGFYREGLDG